MSLATAVPDPVPISEQFVVLENKLPELRASNLDNENRNESRVRMLWERIPAAAKMPLLLAVSSCLILTPVACLYQARVYQRARYTLWQYVPLEKTNDWIELTRWLIVLEIFTAGVIITRYTSLLAPQLIAHIGRRNRQIFSPAFAAFIEIVSLIWKYLCYNLFSTVLWMVAVLVMPYPVNLLREVPKTASATYWVHLPWQFYTERTFLMICLSTYLVTIEKVMLHLISKEFNQSLYRERIQKCMYSLWTMDVLRKAGAIFNYTPISQHVGNFDKLWKLKGYPYASADLMTTFILEHFVKLGKKSGERKQTMAKRLFRFLVRPDRKEELHIEDIRPFFARSEVEKVFSVLDFGNAGDVSESEFVKAVDAVYQERADLIQILATNSDVIRRLDHLMLILVGMIIFFLIFPVVGFSPTEALVPLGVSITPTIVACTLIFGESIKSIFAAIVFLFATHPYDVGDRVYMDQGSYFVRKIELLSTIFERWDGFTVCYPNSVLSTKSICNVRRTGLQSQRIEVSLPANTSSATLALLEKRLSDFIQAESRDFDAIRACSYEMREQNLLVLIIALRHRVNFYDGPERVLRNNKFMRFLTQQVNNLNIEYYSTVRSVALLAPDENK
ncbi:hypothetical protein PSACC_02289 [Paramicrosporidium saccamoebae]|uniref:EF-hand domain-containing protein n=1 Tax=Paramicrosporidium saccamoebae TaxID=1246581 RepID=A0A2H9TJT1_9FUNG|nr:hypothetical protein PSACC_02289 [Paramicrosporidium saccamoebae]